MKGLWQRNKKTVTILLASCCIAFVLLPAAAHSAADRHVEVYLNGQAIPFGDAQPVIQNGRTLVPFRTIFEALGYIVTWDENGQAAKGDKNGFLIELPIDSLTANVGGVEIPLDVPAQIVDGRTMVPLRFVSEHSGFDVVYLSMPDTFKIGIADSPAVTPIPLQPEPRLIVGRVSDERGQAESGIPVSASSVGTPDERSTGVSGEYGYYVIELPESDGEWRVDHTYSMEYNGRHFSGGLVQETTEPIDASVGGVRNMTAIAITGSLHMELAGAVASDGRTISPEDIVLTLSPIGPMLDGTEGETIVKRATVFADGIGIETLPIGQYEITAHYMPPGNDPVSMPLRISGGGSFEDAALPTFQLSEHDGYLIELEVQSPAAHVAQ